MTLPAFDRTTTVVAPVDLPVEALAVLQMAADQRGLGDPVADAVLAWTTDSEEAKTGLFKKAKVVHAAAILTPAVLAWTVAEGDDVPTPLVVRLADAEITDEPLLPPDLPDSVRAQLDLPHDGLHVRADFGQPERGTVFLGLGTDEVAASVRAAILHRWGEVRP